jgi:hypothetical protein
MVDLSNIMFGDGRFERKDLRKYFGEIDGKKIGVVLATKNSGYPDCALNRIELEGLLRAKQEGRLDEVYVVAVSNGRFLEQIEAGELAAKLTNEMPRTGRFGDFYVLHPGIGFPAATAEVW